MGSDFYIHIYLKIEHKNGIAYYEIPAPRGYFPELDGICDSDEEDENHYYYNESFKKLYDDMRKFYLTPRKDLILFENGKFVKPRFEKKYLPMLLNKINHKYIVGGGLKHEEDHGKFIDMADLIKVTKRERRYEPSINSDDEDSDNENKYQNFFKSSRA